MISVLDILEETTADGPGFRTSVYAAGCVNQCPGCHNPESWDIHHGQFYTTEQLLEKILSDEFANVTFSGGDPMFQPEGFTALARAIKEKSKKTIWCYSGYLYEQIIQNERQAAMLPYLDVLVDGRFVLELKDESLLFRGSKNQRIIDVPASLSKGEVVLWEDPSFNRMENNF